MTRLKKTIHTTLCTLMMVTLLTNFGCQPTTEEETVRRIESDNATLEPKTTEVVFKDQRFGGKPVLIDGDLGTVDWPSMIGQQITVKGDLVVVDTYDLYRRGQVTVARDRLYIPTNRVDPNDDDASATSFEGGSNVAKVVGAQKQNDKAIFIIDDGSAKQNIFPPKLFPKLGKTDPTVRIGSVIKGVSGRLIKAGRNLLLVTNKPLKWMPDQRPQRPDIGQADITISSFNVLNYFTTIDDGKNRARGADSTSELKRQEAKLVAAIIALNADVIGLMELENNLDAENQLVAALNKEIGKDLFHGCGLPEGFRTAPGGRDDIRVGIIYRSDRVAPLGEVSMIADDAFGNARTPIVQTFNATTDNDPFTVIVNHFKSKGGADRADVANKNKGDGQGAYNAARRSQALAICTYIAEQKLIDAESRILVIGDLNAYAEEDPIDAMRAKGLVDLREHLNKANEEQPSSDQAEDYSYNYRGQSGSMDHAMATSALADDVTGIATWHINADEPRFLDYNEEFNPRKLYKADPYRSSDHDPVLIGIGK